ncbi:acyl-CoA synthetase [Natrinema gelatinilyticum]|uniref:acyl-CoA synthetase n=1 Tax=Natrinema gelatinilyticum TaxID=2961571 RepID=UPI0020C1CD39|nr:AMP-binding protein [Natrinema gelatinilyticum]
MSNVPRLDAYYFYEAEWSGYNELFEAFEWEIPEQFNMADYVCDRWAEDGDRVAIYTRRADGTETAITFAELREYTNALANYLADQGVERGDRVAVNTPQKPETVVAHVAAWKLGAVSVPLSVLHGPDSVAYRLEDAGCVAAVVDAGNVESFREGCAQVDGCDTVLTVAVDDPEPGERDLWDVVEGGDSEFEPVTTDPEETAIILYTSGTTGDPKGVVHAHRLLLGFLPMLVNTIGNHDVRDDDVFWSPTEWAWIGTLYLVVFPPLFYGQPTVAVESDKFDSEEAFDVIETFDVSAFFAPPTALRMMMQVETDDLDVDVSSMRAISSGGESVGESIKKWANDVFDGAAVNEVYGQTEADPIVCECEAIGVSREGSMGKATLGADVVIVDPETGEPYEERDKLGEIAVDYETSWPICFKEYWNKPEKTAAKIQDGWLLTEDLGRMDEDGYLYFESRKDDVIICSGYRISPEEIEESLAGHDAVVDAGVIGVPDERRGEIPKAFVILAPGYESSDDLVETLQNHVKDRLAKYQYPRAIEFVDTLPQTATGKIQRFELREYEGVE